MRSNSGESSAVRMRWEWQEDISTYRAANLFSKEDNYHRTSFSSCFVRCEHSPADIAQSRHTSSCRKSWIAAELWRLSSVHMFTCPTCSPWICGGCRRRGTLPGRVPASSWPPSREEAGTGRLRWSWWRSPPRSPLPCSTSHVTRDAWRVTRDAPGHVEVGLAGLGSVAKLEHLHGTVGLCDVVQREP